jgi:HPt (histidine-containing phosphotransfer) domain-containing protein
MSEKLYDLHTILDIGGDDTAFIQEMVKMFAAITPDTLQELGEAIRAENWTKAGSLAHSLKANIISYGIAGMREVVLRLEKTATDEEMRQDAQEQYDLLLRVCLEAIRQMQDDYQ